jgi:hypothetical protein
VGPERDDEDPHPGPGPRPKLSLAGRLEGTIDGRPISLVTEGRDLLLRAGSLATLLALRKSWQATVPPLRALLQQGGFRLLARAPWLGKVELFPNPNFLVRLFLPRM